MDIAEISPFAATVYLQDHDRFYLVMLTDAARRADLLVLLAFNLELANVRILTQREAHAGRIRLQWWHDVVQGNRSEEASGNPLARALLDVMVHHRLSSALLTKMIMAREADLTPIPFASMAERAAYIDNTAGILAELCGRILGATKDSDCASCRLAGQKFGSIGLLRAIPYHGGEGWLSLPVDFLSEQGLEPEEVRRGQVDLSRLLAVIRQLLTQEMENKLPHTAVARTILPAALHGRLGRCYGRLLERYDGNPFALPADLRPLALPLKLWWGQVQGRWW